VSHEARFAAAVALPILLVGLALVMLFVVMPAKARRLDAQEAYLRAHSEERSTGWRLVRKSAPWLILALGMLGVGVIFHARILILGGILGFVGHAFDQYRSAKKKREHR
jgi:hypothetical protein